MGILDDAIRQHLDLKRRHGAEETEVKQLEDEAFGLPTRPGEPDFPESQEQAVVPGDAPSGSGEQSASEGPSEEATALLDPERPAEASPAAAAAAAPEAPAPPAEAALPPEPEASTSEAAPAERTEAEAPAPQPAAPSSPEPESEETPAFFDQALEDELDLADLDLDLDDEGVSDLAGEAQLEPASTEMELEPASDEPPIEPASTEHAVEPASEEYSAEPVSDELPLEPASTEHELEPISDEQPISDEHPVDHGPDTVEHPMEQELGLEPDDSGQAPAPDTGDETATSPADAEDDDVLEETPEFLRDQPEDDELWFEQGEPKDFDF